MSNNEYGISEIEKTVAKHRESKWMFINGNLSDYALIEKTFTDYKFNVAINLAAHEGIR